MDKETLSNYGWIVICVLVLAVMIALAGPFGNFIADAVKSTTQGLFDTNQSALDAAGITIEDQAFWQAQNGAKIYYDRVYTISNGGAAGIWHRDGSMTLYLHDMHSKGMCDRFTRIPASQITVSGNRVSHPDVFAPEYGEMYYEAVNDGEIVSVAYFWWSWNGNKEIISRDFVGMVDSNITDYTSIETWYNDTFNS